MPRSTRPAVDPTKRLRREDEHLPLDVVSRDVVAPEQLLGTARMRLACDTQAQDPARGSDRVAHRITEAATDTVVLHHQHSPGLPRRSAGRSRLEKILSVPVGSVRPRRVGCILQA